MFKKTIAIIVSLFVALVAIISGLIYINKQKIIQTTISMVNERLEAEVQVQGITDITFFSSFPMVSIVFPKVYIKDRLRKNDTLAYINELHLYANPLELYKKNYTIESVKASGGFLNLYINDKGEKNYNIFKASSDENSKPIDLKQLWLENIKLSYIDVLRYINIDLYSTNSKLKVQLFKKDITIDIELSSTINKLHIKDLKALAGSAVNGNITLNYDAKKDCIELNKNALYIGKNELKISGDICLEEKLLHLRADIIGKSIKDAISLLPKKWTKDTNLNGNGKFSLKSKIGGTFEKPKVDIEFNIKEAKLNLESLKIQLNNVNLFGKYYSSANGNETLNISSFSFDNKKSYLNGSVYINDLKNPLLVSKINGVVNFNILDKFMPEKFTAKDGNLYIKNLECEILKSKKTKKWHPQKIVGKIDVKQLEGTIVKLKLPYTINGTLEGQENILAAKDLKILIGENDLSFNGTLKNIISRFLNMQSGTIGAIEVYGSLYSKKFNLNNFILNSSKKNVANVNISIPEIFGSLDVNIDQFTYQKLEIKKMRLKANASGQNYVFDIKNTNALNGQIKSIISTRIHQNNFEVNIESQIDHVDIQKLFYSFNNFGLKHLNSKNIKGYLTSSLKLSSTWKDFKTFNKDAFLMQAHIMVHNGELNHFKPLEKLAGTIDIEQLRNIYFNTLETDIFIKNQKIEFPLSDIKSNLVSIKAGGTHTFNNEINYNIILNLKNVLAAKFKKQKTLNKDFTNNVEGGINIYLNITGTLENPIVKYDRSKAMEKIRDDFKKEKEEFTKLFKKEEKSEFQNEEPVFEELNEENKYLEWEE